MTDFTTFLPGFAAAYAILLVAASSPGPAVAMLLGIGLGQGRGPALTASAGIATGSVVLNLGTIFGIGLLLSQAAWAMQAVRAIGAAYLLWLAWGAFRRAAAKAPPPRAASVAPAPAWRHFAAGFALQVTNPKAIVFWLAINAVGATQGGGAAVIAAFAFGAWIVSFLCHGAWALLLSSAPVRAAYARARRGIEGTLGAFFALFALRLALDR
ncbi:threonine/homoserine/homoserine lactone efflux protein [Hasllibacter halocynthiae]|uniref:Threonine/homoserine/homoserine lactone efflux protein n=1 Tax=Hasllibacter halocynthiae TaxID=595589 RepID=A0A2T0X348_9RHOB|nr:LysE family translocator [Hasllibacter halocynthiae]PRY93325.1 threonine/homoserine/homoserine lactone efflux protein [Hasllibacter halocynthiae]